MLLMCFVFSWCYCCCCQIPEDLLGLFSMAVRVLHSTEKYGFLRSSLSQKRGA